MQTFILIWLGQVVSLVGSGLTRFALGVWLYQTTGSATQLSLIYLFARLPFVIFAPLGGAIADRWNRRWLMILSDIGSSLSSLAIVLLMWNGSLEIWHIYLAVGFSSSCEGFQNPAYRTIPTLLVPRQDFGRANGMIQLGLAAENLFSPILAGILIEVIQVKGVILIDFVTFTIALIPLLIIRFPQLHTTHQSIRKQGTVWQQIIYGFSYVKDRPGLFMLLVFFFITNFTIGIAQVLITPMVLGFTSPSVLGRILSIGGSGWLFGGLLMSTWGGPQPRINGIIAGELLFGLAILLTGLQPSPLLITIGAFIFFFNVPIIMGSSDAIWQVKVPLPLQGRVFAFRSTIAWSSYPLAYLVAGPLSDRIFQPLLIYAYQFNQKSNKFLWLS